MPTAETELPVKKAAPSRPAREKDRVDSFAHRHIGPNQSARAAMLAELGFENLDELADATVPSNIRLDRPVNLPDAKSESEALEELRVLARKNTVTRSFLGAGYYGTVTPPVIQRNILENPGWYTAYTPYQAEIAQGRLEALLNFQTMITDLTALDIANASLLDEGTAAAEAMTLCRATVGDRSTFLVANNCHPQTIEIVQTRASEAASASRWSLPHSRSSNSMRRSSVRLFNIRQPTARSSITSRSQKQRMTPERCWLWPRISLR